MRTSSEQIDRSRAPADGPPPACAHCGRPVPRGHLEAGSHAQFCCAGCRAVYGALRGMGLGEYYARRAASGGRAVPAPAGSARGRAYAEFADERFRALHCRRTPDGLTRAELFVEGVHCAACVWLIERLPHLLEGVREARLDMRRATVALGWDDETVSLPQIAQLLARLGYPPHPARGREAEHARRAEERRFLVAIAIAGALAGNVMVISFALYGAAFHGMEAAHAQLFRWTSLVLATIAVAGPGRVFFRGAAAAVRARTPNMDLPIALGLLAGFAWSAAATLRGAGEVYFDSITVLIFLLLVGRWIQRRQQRRSGEAITALFSLTPAHARLVSGDEVQDVPVDALVPGQTVEVRAGESLPADGIVRGGSAALTRAWLTGESRPAHVETGDEVEAATTVLGGRLLVEVVTTGEQTRVGQLLRLVEDSARRRAPILHLADRIAGVFVVAVVALAVVGAAAWSLVDPARAVESAMALLLVTCPCALALATPLAVVSAIGQAARGGMLVKGGAALEALREPGLVLLDKTGTITTGRMSVLEWHGAEDVKPAVAALEACSAHPVALAFVDAAPPAAGGAAPRVQVEPTPTVQAGMAGLVDGCPVAVGASAFLEQRSICIPAWARRAEQEIAARARTPVLVAVDGAVRAVAGLGDTVHPGAREAVATMRRRGWRVGILSGDHPDVVRAVGAELGLPPEDCRGGCGPEEKLRVIERARAAGAVVMVGDGVNDAAALAAATVGIAARGGAEASLGASDVYLQHPGLGPVTTLLEGAARTVAVIRRNLALSLVYNVIGASLALGGLITPILAAVLMPISSLTVITLSYRSRMFPRGDAPCR